MKERIAQHFNHLFEDAPKTRKALDLKQEMLQNANDKYDDLILEGYSEEDAYQNVIGSIGDVTELFEEVEEKNLLTLSEQDRKKKAMLTAVAVGLYIFAGAVFFLFVVLDDLFGNYGMDYATLGIAVAALICIIPTIMLVYASNMYPGYTKKPEPDMVEQYKEEKYLNNRNKAIHNALSAIIWTLASVVYFLVSFATMAWYITWVIFLIAGCVQSLVELVLSLKQQDR